MQIFKNLFAKKKTPFIEAYKMIAKDILQGKELSKSGEPFSNASKNNYKTMVNRFMLFEKENGTIYIDDININWADQLSICLMENGYTKNSIANTRAVLKAMLNRMFKKGISKFNGSGISCRSEQVTTVYNTVDEIKKILDTDLTETPGYNRIRNLYVIHCFIGLRFSDFKRVVKSPKDFIIREAGRTFLKIKTQKTGEIVIVPISKIVEDLLFLHNYNFPEGFTSSYYNKSIKEVAKRAGIEESVIFTRTKGGERADTIFKKYELMSSHTARRSFATNATLLGISQKMVMSITGHRTAESFEKYVRSTKIENAIQASNHYFFNLDLPLPLLISK